ncbi:class I adenylate-forming enzyme family protein [Propionibacteriaceae bacterium Y1685]
MILGGLAALWRHGVTLTALADFLERHRGDQAVLVDRDGPMTGRALIGAAREAPPPTSLVAVSDGHHDRRSLVAVFAAALRERPVLLTDPYGPRPVLDEETPSTGFRLMLGTSGTSGAPRHSARPSYGVGILRPVRQLFRALDLGGGRPLLVQPALHHGYGLGFALAGLLAGSPVLLPADADHLQQLIIDHDPRTSVSAPPQLDRLAEIGADWTPDSMVTGSGPLHPELCRRATARFGPVLHNLYGSTEAGFAAMATPQHLARRPGCVGRALHGVGIQLRDGEVWVDSPFGTAGSGYVDTGDLGHLEDGLLIIDRRRDPTAVVGGQNISLIAVRDALAAHPLVASAEVTTAADEVFGEQLVATIRVLGEVDDQDLAEHVRTVVGYRARLASITRRS